MKSEVIETARTYYNSDDADNFYYQIWGGEDIHVGCYETDAEPIRSASERTVEMMASQLKLRNGDRVIDLGAGYGGAARWLVRNFQAHVTCLNLSEVQNQRNREMNLVAGLDRDIDVLDGAFEEIPSADHSYKIAWSQDSFLHSPDRFRVFQEVDRILQSGGEFIFTDIMARENADPSKLQPVLDRIHLDSLGSVKIYTEYAAKLGWKHAGTQLLTPNLITHYTRVGQELAARRGELGSSISKEYVDRMLNGLNNWVTAGKEDVIEWGILHFTK